MSALWLTVAAQRIRLGLAARKVLSQGSQLALRGVPDLSMDLMGRLAHGALLTRGAESGMPSLAGHRVQRYAFAGRNPRGRPVLLLHGLGGPASSMAPLVQALVPLAPRVVLLELPGHGRSPDPAAGPLSAREHGAVVIACVEELARERGAGRAVARLRPHSAAERPAATRRAVAGFVRGLD